MGTPEGAKQVEEMFMDLLKVLNPQIKEMLKQLKAMVPVMKEVMKEMQKQKKQQLQALEKDINLKKNVMDGTDQKVKVKWNTALVLAKEKIKNIADMIRIALNGTVDFRMA